MIEVLSGYLEDVLAIRASGKVTGEDYEEVLMPAVEQAAASGEKIKFLYQTAPDFDGYTAGALWDDAKVGLQHLNAFEKIAVVTDHEAIVGAVKAFGFLMPCPVRGFPPSDEGEAKRWISS